MLSLVGVFVHGQGPDREPPECVAHGGAVQPDAYEAEGERGSIQPIQEGGLPQDQVIRRVQFAVLMQHCSD